MAASAHIRKMLDDDHLNSVPARLVSVFPFNSWPVHQHVSQIEKTCYLRPEDKQVKVEIEHHQRETQSWYSLSCREGRSWQVRAWARHWVEGDEKGLER